MDVETPPRKPRIYMKPRGRMGNRLFKIATGYALAHQYNRQLVLDDQYKSLVNAFPKLNEITFTKINDELNATPIPEDGFAKYSSHRFRKLTNMSDVLLVGYFQSFKYFSGYENDIRQLFRFSETLIAKATQTLKNIHTDYTNKHCRVLSLTFVGLHIRKGDLTGRWATGAGFQTANAKYIYKAMYYFQRKYKNVAFVLRTDTPSWSKDNLFMEAVYKPPPGSPKQDLALLSLCNHTITSVGTFSWWAGWLAGGEVTYYHQPYKMSSVLGKRFDAEDFFPAHWLPISNMSQLDIERLAESSWSLSGCFK